MEVNIVIIGNLKIDDSDLQRLQAEGPDDLYRTMRLNNVKITTKVTEVYQKQVK